MNRAQIFGLLRHAATVAGGVLLASGTQSNSPTQSGIGLLLTLLGGGASLAKHAEPAAQVTIATSSTSSGPASAPTAEAAPAPTPSPINTIVPLILAALLVGIGFVGTACSSTSTTGGKINIDAAAAITQIAVKNIVVPVLTRNPSLEPAFIDLAAGIDDVFARGELTPEQITAFVAVLGKKYSGLKEQDLLLITSAIEDAYTLYSTTTGKKILVTTDPDAAKVLLGFKNGLLSGISFYHATQGITATPAK
jgi:hypothetical protein